MSEILSPFDQKINELYPQRDYFCEQNQIYTYVKCHSSTFIYKDIKDKTLS
jgi:hypothetical protein